MTAEHDSNPEAYAGGGAIAMDTSGRHVQTASSFKRCLSQEVVGRWKVHGQHLSVGGKRTGSTCQ